MLWEKNMQNEPFYGNQSMRTHSMLRRALTVPAFAAAFALISMAAQGQNTNLAPQGRRGAPGIDPRNGQAKVQPAGAVQYDLDIEENAIWSGGPDHRAAIGPANLATIVEHLREAHQEANIALAPELQPVMVENLKLHATSMWDELEALRIASGGKFIISTSPHTTSSEPQLFIIQPSERFLNEMAAVASPAPRPIQVEAFNFSSYFERQRRSKPMDDETFARYRMEQIDQTTKIIETTLLSVTKPAKPSGQGISDPGVRCLFHEGANLLVVTSSSEEAMSVARTIINAIIELWRPDPETVNVKDRGLSQLPGGASAERSYESMRSTAVLAEPFPGGSANTNSTPTNH